MELIKTMKPTRRTLFLRKCKIVQFIRFIALNLRILKTAWFPPRRR
ncbi:MULTISPECIES: hypothetical protein [Kyrpidia]|nr:MULTISPECIES: hypothetical protein [Kyrpidia]MCL6574607.1 hypothetical protein [Kyrpidia sp.]